MAISDKSIRLVLLYRSMPLTASTRQRMDGNIQEASNQVEAGLRKTAIREAIGDVLPRFSECRKLSL
jgi:hypothetical protein